MKNDSERINKIQEILLAYIQKDFSQKIPVSEKEDELDAIAAGLNILGEELHAFVAEKKQHEEEIKKINASLEQKIIERTQEVFRSEMEYRSLIEQATDGIFIFGDSGKFTEVNLSACKMLGYTKEELLNLNFNEILLEEDAKNNPPRIQELLEGKSILSTRIFRRKDNSVFPVEINAKMLPNGKLLGMVRDITERKQAEEKINKLNEDLEKKVIERTSQLELANKELEAFTYSVSHDLRAPLRSVNGYAQLLNEDYGNKLDDEGKRFIETIRNNAKRMGMLIDDLLAFSRLGRKEIEKSEVNLNELVAEVIADINKSFSHAAKIEVNSLPTVKADYGLLRLAIFNLLSNAIKYSSKQDFPLVKINAEEKNNELTFSIKDNGVGFDMKYYPKLFGVFQRLHSNEEFEGTGVGLAIVHRIISRHGGKTWAESQTGKGATFYFSL